MGKWVLVVFLSSAACGGALATDPQDAGRDAEKDAKTDSGVVFGYDAALADAFVITEACPLSQPSPDAPCTQLGEECEYGASFFKACDTVFRCDPVSRWWVPETQSPSPMCSAGSSGCPAQLSDITSGTCNNVGSLCEYPDGVCTCDEYCGGPPPPQGGSTGFWSCFKSTPACPVARPRIGMACAQEGQQCNYVVCCSGSEIVCHDGVWQDQPFTCGL